MVMFQILLDDAQPCDAGTTQLSSPVCQFVADVLLCLTKFNENYVAPLLHTSFVLKLS